MRAPTRHVLSSAESVPFLVMMLITPASASVPYTTDIGPSTISMRSTLLMSIWLRLDCSSPRSIIGIPFSRILMLVPLIPISSKDVSPSAMSLPMRIPISVLSSDSMFVGVFRAIDSLVIDRTL